MDLESNLLDKIVDRKAIVGVIGVGYVGSALIDYAALAGFEILGFTRSSEKAKILNEQNSSFKATNDFSLLASCDVVCVCVPTPVYPDKKPDLNPIKESTNKIKKYLRPGQLIIVESSIAPGTTRNFILPILLESGMLCGKDFFLSFSPERVDPGNLNYNIKNTAKLVSGIDKISLILAEAFYKEFIDEVVPVSSLEAAEMAKILENTYRLVNISLVNELLDYTDSIGIDIWEVIRAAGTKPFGYLPHYPGPGIGGHCIPVDPFYLLDDAKKRGINLKIVNAAGKVNDEQPRKIADRAAQILHETNGKHRDRILLVGVSYKPDIGDVRESPALKLWAKLEEQGIDVDYHDPYVPNINGFKSKELSLKEMDKYDLIIIVTNHKKIDYGVLLQVNKPILDTRNVFSDHQPNVYVP